MVDVGEWLVERRGELDRGEAGWLERLAEFDRDGLWAAEGHLSCVSWLVWRTNMGRSTAFDKLRVAHQLARRPLVAEAFAQGRLSYSAVRAITRLDRPDPGVDQALVALAESGRASIVDIERVVRSYHLYADQDRPPPDEAGRSRSVKIRRGDDGTGQVIVTLSDIEIEEFAAALQAFVDRRYRPRPGDQSSAGDSAASETPWEEPGRPGDEVFTGRPPPAKRRWRRRRRPAKTADAFMDLVHTALNHANGGQAAGDDRYLVHLVTRTDRPGMATLDGRPLHPADAAMIACDTSTVTHTISVTRANRSTLAAKPENGTPPSGVPSPYAMAAAAASWAATTPTIDIHHIQALASQLAPPTSTMAVAQCRPPPPHAPPPLPARRQPQQPTALLPPRRHLLRFHLPRRRPPTSRRLNDLR